LAQESESYPVMMMMMIAEDYELRPLFHSQRDTKCFEC